MDNMIEKELEKAYSIVSKKAMEFTQQNKFREAIEAYKQALSYKPKQIQVMGELCWCLGQVEEYEEMLEYAKRALLIAQKRDSKDNIGRFYFYIAQYYKVKEDYEKASNYLTLSVINKPYFMQNYIEKAYCQRMLGNFSKAIELYNIVKELDNDYAEEIGLDDLIKKTSEEEEKNNNPKEQSYVKIAVEHEKKGDVETANKYFFEAVKANPNDFLNLFLLYKNVLKLNRDKYEIIAIGENLIPLLNKKENVKVAPIFLELVYLGLSKCYEIIGDQDKADKYSNMNKFYNHINIAQKANKEGDYEKSIEEYKKAIEINKNNLVAIDELLDLLFKTEKLDEAMNYSTLGLIQAKEANDIEHMAKYRYDMGYHFELVGYDKAIEFYESALNSSEQVDNQLKYCYKIAYYYYAKGLTTKALEYFKKCNDYIEAGAKDIYDIQSNIIKQEELLDKNSDLMLFEKHFNIGAKFFNERNCEEAAKEMKLALSFIPQELEALDVLQRCLFGLKKYDECYDIAYEGYLVSCRDHDYRFYDMFCYNIANILYNSKKNQEALKFYKLASDQKPDDKDYLYFIGACYRNMGQYDKAIAYFQKVLELDSNDEGAKEQFSLCMYKMQHLDN